MVRVVSLDARRRPDPPDHLPDAARRCFVSIVESAPAGHFRPSDLDLLCRYAEATAAAERAAFEMSQPAGLVTEDGKVSPWWTVHQGATKTLSGLALRLRLGPQARALKQSKRDAPSPSAYDLMRAERDWDKA
jgi:phage terminase small subunit